MAENNLDILDRKILANLKGFARSESFLPRLFATFEEHGLVSLQELENASLRQDRGALSAVAHRFKGSCLNLGAQALAAHLMMYEERQDPPLAFEAVACRLAETRDLFVRTCKELKNQ